MAIRNHPDSNLKLTDVQLDTLGRRYRLAPREKQILALLFEGLPTNQAIADRLDTTEAAIKAGVRTLYLKTRTERKHEMIRNLMLDLLNEHYRTTDRATTRSASMGAPSTCTTSWRESPRARRSTTRTATRRTTGARTCAWRRIGKTPTTPSLRRAGRAGEA